MKDQYHIDLSKYSLQKFKKNLLTREMIPSRVILKDKIEERFNILEANELKNLRELIDKLKTKQKIESFANLTGLSIEYLAILKREASSYLSNPVSLSSFPKIKREYVEILEKEGIKNSKQLFSKAKDKDDRGKLAESTAIPMEYLEELIYLSDLSRAYGVGPVFARILYDVGIHSIKQLISHSPEELVNIYEEKSGKKADFSADDIRFSIDLAKELDIAVEI